MCTLDINISFDNCSLLKLHQSQTLQRIYGQHPKEPEKKHDILKPLDGINICFKSKITWIVMLFLAFINNVSILSVFLFLFLLILVLNGSTLCLLFH